MRTRVFFIFLVGFIVHFNHLFPQLIWKGDTRQFAIHQNQITSDMDANLSQSELYSPTQINGECTWKFTISYDFNPSSANHAIVYLAGNEELFEKMNGYYLVMGATNDALHFYRRSEGKDRLLIQGNEQRLDLNTVKLDVEIKRDSAGDWQVFTRLPDEPNYVLEGSASDAQFNYFFRLGWVCKYTKTRADKFTLSDLTIQEEANVDTIPPEIKEAKVLGKHTLEITFNEPIKPHLADVLFAPHSILIDSISISNSQMNIHLKTALTENTFYQLTLKNVQDVNGNTAPDLVIPLQYFPFTVQDAFICDSTTIFVRFSAPVNATQLLSNSSAQAQFPTHVAHTDGSQTGLLLYFQQAFAANHYFPFHLRELANAHSAETLDTTLDLVFHPIEQGELVVNEIMADPSPPVELPEVEYIELYNHSDYPIPLPSFMLHIGSRELTFQHYRTLSPGSYLLLLGKNDSVAYPELPNTAIANTSLFLSNSGFDVWLSNANQQVIDYYPYDPSALYSSFKAHGGWSVERLDFENPSDEGNWAESQHLDGGTPGRQNSVFTLTQDENPPQLRYIALPNDSTLVACFSEEMMEEELTYIGNYTLTDAPISTVEASYPSQQQVTLHLSKPLTPAKTYTLTIQNLADVSGNTLETLKHTFQLPEPVSYQSLVFNEVMVDPLDGCAEYIEFYNRSFYFVNLSNLVLSQLAEDGRYEKGTPLTSTARLLAPNQYLLLTKSAAELRECHSIPPNAILLDISNLPTLNNTADAIALLTTSAQLIDALSYTTEWHSPLVKNSTGVALERISTEAPTNDGNNWTSAASVAGFATPGLANSQALPESPGTNKVHLAYENITPDNDGNRDALLLHIPEKYAGYAITLQAFDAHGRLVQELYNHYLLGTQTTLTVTRFDPELFPSGIYALRVFGIHPNGGTLDEMLPFVISFQ